MVTKKGAKIRIMHGELEWLYGIYVELRGEDRAMILLDLLQRRVKAIPYPYNRH